MGVNEFRDCLQNLGMEDISQSGLHFIWNQKPGKTHGILKKLDRVIGNHHFLEAHPDAYAHFMPFLSSDHTPAVLNLPVPIRPKPRPFKFPNFLANKHEFSNLVADVWSKHIPGIKMYSIVNKLKLLKTPLRKLKYDQGNLTEKVNMWHN